jgi:peptidoglycan/LPS O-acetylase OafA/YrhL
VKQTFHSIQALRGLAASLVVVAHTFEHPSRGDPNALPEAPGAVAVLRSRDGPADGERLAALVKLGWTLN